MNYNSMTCRVLLADNRHVRDPVHAGFADLPAHGLLAVIHIAPDLQTIPMAAPDFV